MDAIEELRGIALFDGLDDARLAQLRAAGQVSTFEPGGLVWSERDPADTWWVLLEGEITLSRVTGSEETVLGAMSMPGQWAGGFGAWDPTSRYFATGRAAARTRLLEVPADALHRLSEEWFHFGVHFIRGLIDTVRRVEATARQRESLVALGTLAAGLAHEINNPASAAARAVDAMQQSSDALLSSLAQLTATSISPAQLLELDALRRSVEQPTHRAASGLEAADREDELSDWLSDHGVDRDWELAPVLTAAGVDTSWCERVAAIVDADALGAAIAWVAHAFTMGALLAEVRDATHRISGLVGAVRSYSQLDRAAVQRIDVTEGIESTVVMLAHKLRDGIEVERDFAPDLPLIEAIPGELNQVWTNLIDNAVDAMGGVGTLRLAARAEDGRVVVEIADTGPGMPAEVQARAFEPFFTTKDVGKGTGLGLDISRRIVTERHSGEIAIESEPGRTVIRVWLPLLERQ